MAALPGRAPGEQLAGQLSQDGSERDGQEHMGLAVLLLPPSTGQGAGAGTAAVQPGRIPATPPAPRAWETGDFQGLCLLEVRGLVEIP